MSAASIEPDKLHPEPGWADGAVDAESECEPEGPDEAADTEAGSAGIREELNPVEEPPPGLVAADEPQLVAWLDAIIGHDERALAALYDATVNRVFGLVRRIVRNESMVEEVVEDTYFQVWRQAVRYDSRRGTAIAWLLAMARSRAIDALRRETRFRHDPLDDEPGDSAMPVDELLDIARTHADLQQALTLIGAQPRQLVSLAFFRGLSHEEISEQMRLPLGTVKSQIRRALLMLHQILGESASPTSSC